jgi:hypothetical protein
LNNFVLSGPAQNLHRWQDRAEFEQPAATWAGSAARGFDLWDGQIESEAVAQFDQAADSIERNLTVGVHKAVVADFHEAGGQHVLEKAADELDNIKSQDSSALAVGFAIANQHGAILDANDA